MYGKKSLWCSWLIVALAGRITFSPNIRHIWLRNEITSGSRRKLASMRSENSRCLFCLVLLSHFKDVYYYHQDPAQVFHLYTVTLRVVFLERLLKWTVCCYYCCCFISLSFPFFCLEAESIRANQVHFLSFKLCVWHFCSLIYSIKTYHWILSHKWESKSVMEA